MDQNPPEIGPQNERAQTRPLKTITIGRSVDRMSEAINTSASLKIPNYKGDFASDGEVALERLREAKKQQSPYAVVILANDLISETGSLDIARTTKAEGLSPYIILWVRNKEAYKKMNLAERGIDDVVDSITDLVSKLQHRQTLSERQAESQPMPSGDDQAKEALQLGPGDILSPWEMYLIGAGYSVNDQIVDIDQIIDQARLGDKEAKKRLLTPAFLQVNHSAEAIKMVREKRAEDRQKKAQSGYLKVLEMDKMASALESGINFFLELGEVDEQGLISESEKIFLVNNQGEYIANALVLGNQSIAPQYASKARLGNVATAQREGKLLFYRSIQPNLNS